VCEFWELDDPLRKPRDAVSKRERGDYGMGWPYSPCWIHLVIGWWSSWQCNSHQIRYDGYTSGDPSIPTIQLGSKWTFVEWTTKGKVSRGARRNWLQKKGVLTFTYRRYTLAGVIKRFALPSVLVYSVHLEVSYWRY
jgi:hypothetical protein